jgi:beta-lactamase regulating signal transducer with metallopeptidase domain
MTHLVAWLWQGIVIAGVTTLAVRVIPPASASKRHFLWWMALVFTLALPLLDRFNWLAGSELQAVTGAHTQSSGFILPIPPAWLISGALAICAGIGILSFCRLAFSLRTLRQVLLSSRPFDANRAERLTRWRAARQSRRQTELRVSNELDGACAAGFHRPTILVSSSLAAALTDDVLEWIILHEQAHLERFDDWSRAVQCVVFSLARWHPAVWWISRNIDVERESACDQRVIERACSPLAYARGLAEAAELIVHGRGCTPLLAPGSSITTPMLRLRIERLLATSPVPSPAFSSWASAAACTVVASVAIGLSNAPQLVTFTAGVAHRATLASTSYFIGAPHEFPVAFASPRTIELPFEDNGTAAPQTIDVISEPVAMPAVESSAIHTTTISPRAIVGNATSPSMPSGAAEHLASTSIPFLVRVPVTQPAAVPVTQPAAPREADGIDWSALGRTSAAAGIAVGKAGTATGLAASRAGTSVGRFFKSGGLAFARSF